MRNKREKIEERVRWKETRYRRVRGKDRGWRERK
jgi:hypothetical protein